MDTAHPLTDPERQFLGCLMWLSADQARRLLTGMRADDLADPMATFVLQLAIELVADGHPPAPVALFVHAVRTGRATGEHRQHRLGGWLRETYSDVTPALAGWLKTVVLENAWRRALTAHAQRLIQAAESSPAEIVRDLADDTTAEELWTRYRDTLSESAGIPRLDAHRGKAA
ncbi:hypothetical protein ACIQUM_02490 [Amycolatopsis azurea]|uniref:hypothetical protein n=1 Tax=Amycolatopsis azurea TaxID=36819 RepID=UPI0037FEA585